jgi:hypothetical protein
MNKEQIGLKEVHQELVNSNKLMILNLIRVGIQQKDLAESLGVDGSAISRMFPKGLLKKVAHLSKGVNSSGE